MTRDRTIQAIAASVVVVGTAASGMVLPNLIAKSDHHALRYTNVSVDGAPPFVALGTAIGAVRGLIVDYLWMKVHFMQEDGLFYEIMADTELITKLQPRFAAVWAFHGHNMAYNISVATDTEIERWEWVNAGIRLVREEGLRHNPNDLQLHRELAFWFAHKIEGVADDAHIFYKTEFCKEWHQVLGEPPETVAERVEWLREIADAPATLQEAYVRVPELRNLVSALRTMESPLWGQLDFEINRQFVRLYTDWQQVTQMSVAAQALDLAAESRQRSVFFKTFDELATRPEWAEAWKVLVAHARKRVLEDEYNMEPRRMLRYTEQLGPIDWRNAHAHALYWARRANEIAEDRVANQDDIYKILNNDRMFMQSMQGLARFGRIYYDPLSNELPARLPDPRWIDTIHDEFLRIYAKHYETRGGGPESFIGFFQNFISSAIREWYRAGERAKAQAMMDEMDKLFGSGQSTAFGRDPRWSQPLDTFVWRETWEEYEFQPHLAPSEVAASLRYGFIIGLGTGRDEVLNDALGFADQVTDHFKGNEYYDYVNKFGVGRIKDIIGNLEQSRNIVFRAVMLDRSIPLHQRRVMWSRADQVDPELRKNSYDFIRPYLERELSTSVYGQSTTIDEALPEPPGMQAHRIQMAARARAEAERGDERDATQRSGSGSGGG